MNRENIQKVRDVIAALPPERFNMDVFGPGDARPIAGTAELLKGCGTAACIAGWAKAVLGPRSPRYPDDYTKRAFGLDDNAAFHLFFGHGAGVSRHRLTIPQAVRCLDILAETGEVDWGRAVAEVPAVSP